MKKLLLGIALLTFTIRTFGQGTILFESFTSSGNIITLNGSPIQPGTYTVGLLFNPSTSGNVPLSQMQEIAVYSPTYADSGNAPGYFYDPTTIITPSGSGAATFAVVTWLGNYSDVQSAIDAGAVMATTSEFVRNMGSYISFPPTPPVALANDNSGWDGNLVLTGVVPEPTIAALGGCGAAILLALRRRKLPLL
jgi:hypothetical protein